jgi:conjugal transfer pilus assembly protein TraA
MKKFVKPVVTAVVVGVSLVAINAIAGTDSTFSQPLTTISGWLNGSMGKMFAVGALAVGLGVGITKQSLMSVAVGTGLGLAATAGPAVIQGMFTATF